MTTSSDRHDPIDLASYLARRSVMLAVVAFGGLTYRAAVDAAE